MTSPEERQDLDVPAWTLRIARAFGYSEVRARWKVIHFKQGLRRLRASIGFSTGQRTVLRHRLRQTPMVTFALLLAMFVIYARMFLLRPGQGYQSWDSSSLVAFGAYWPPRIRDGEWWRLGTANFLHIGLWHLGFNALALGQVGPQLEETFGRARVLFFFVATGVFAFAACLLWNLEVVSAGASGSLMGLIGVAAAWGQRDGSSIGRGVRDQMLKWALYTIVFGYFIGANNVAHAGGFLSGVALGACYRPALLAQTKDSWASRMLGLVGLLATVGCFARCMFPGATPLP